MTGPPHTPLLVPLLPLLRRPMPSSSRHAADMGSPRAQGDSCQAIFCLEDVHGPLFHWSNYHQLTKGTFSFSKEQSYWIPTPVSFIWKWLRYSAFSESFWLKYPSFNYWIVYVWPVFLLNTQGLFASFHLPTQCTSHPISVGKKGRWEQPFHKQRHFYFILSMHPGAAVLVTTHSHGRKTVLCEG